MLLHLAPNLQLLNISNNTFLDLPPSFINSVLSHPTLETPYISDNERLGIRPPPSAPCAIHRFLSKLLKTATSSTLTLRDLKIHFTGTSNDCYCPLIEEILALKSKGLRYLEVGCSTPNVPHYLRIADLLEDNLFAQGIITHSETGGHWGPHEEVRKELMVRFRTVMDRNKRLMQDTHCAALRLLQVARLVSHGKDAGPNGVIPLPSIMKIVAEYMKVLEEQGLPIDLTKGLNPPSDYFRLLDMPPEIQHVIFSTFCDGALSERQVLSVLRYATDRDVLTQKGLE